jgi:OOP family OmpA-OmpF porin
MNAYVKKVLVAARPDSDGDGIVDGTDRCDNTPQNVSVDGFGCPLDDDGDRVANYRDNCPGTPAGTKVDTAGCAIPVVVAPVATKSAVVTAEGTWLYNKIKFESGKAKLKSSSSGELDEILNGLNTQPDLKLEIQGHTDIRGARDYNLALSQKRADAVKTYLVSRNVDPSRLTVRGFGPDRPIAGNDTAAGRAANRRVEVKPVQ